MTDSEIRESIMTLLKSCNRSGMPYLIKYLCNDTDYFTAPASTKYHDAIEGGLARHSLKVFRIFSEKLIYHNVDTLLRESLIICALLHDLCKVNFYIANTDKATPAQIDFLKNLVSKNYTSKPDYDSLTKREASRLINELKTGQKEKELATSADVMAYKIDDKFPLGHGEKSLFLIQKFICLTNEEACLIRYHMGEFENKNDYYRAVELYPLIVLLYTSDYESTKYSAGV
jgi:hypothetical protein